MQKDANVFSEKVHEILGEQANADAAKNMSAYMKNRFAFFGIPTPLRRSLIKPLFAEISRTPDADRLLATAEALWQYDERECQYVAVDLLVKYAHRIDAAHEGRIAMLVRTKPWWDTTDPLAARVYGDLVLRSPALHPVIHAYAEHEDMWLRRVAILHQLHYGLNTDEQRLADALNANLQHPDFFIRKAMGWALRQYARSNPDWVRNWLAQHEKHLSALTLREARKHL